MLKNTLVTNRFLANQQLLNDSLFVKPPNIAREWIHLSVEEQIKYDKRTYNYCYFGCHQSTMNYNRYPYLYDDDKRKISKRYIKALKKIPLYSKYKGYHLHDNHTKNKMNESLWFNCKLGGDLISVTGNYNITRTKLGYWYRPNSTLYLNGISVKYINMQVHNIYNHYNICIKLNFCQDLTPYCHMIDYVLACYYRRFKYILFSYLPLEIIHHILYLSSIY